MFCLSYLKLLKVIKIAVAILVVVEYVLSRIKIIGIDSEMQRRNPCCRGICSVSFILNGTKTSLIRVAILVVVEYVLSHIDLEIII